MKKISYGFMILVFAVTMISFSGCKPGNKTADKFEALQKDACACKTLIQDKEKDAVKGKECADKVFGQFKTLYAASKNEKVGSNAYNRIKKASSEIGRCLVESGLNITEILDFGKQNAK